MLPKYHLFIPSFCLALLKASLASFWRKFPDRESIQEHFKWINYESVAELQEDITNWISST